MKIRKTTIPVGVQKNDDGNYNNSEDYIFNGNDGDDDGDDNNIDNDDDLNESILFNITLSKARVSPVPLLFVILTQGDSVFRTVT